MKIYIGLDACISWDKISHFSTFFPSIVYIWPAEWAELQKFFRIDVEINVTRIDDELGHVTFIVTPGEL